LALGQQAGPRELAQMSVRTANETLSDTLVKFLNVLGANAGFQVKL